MHRLWYVIVLVSQQGSECILSLITLNMILFGIPLKVMFLC